MRTDLYIIKKALLDSDKVSLEQEMLDFTFKFSILYVL